MAVSDIPAILAFRFLPFLGAMTLSRGTPLGRRLFAWAFFALLVGFAFLQGRDLSEVLARTPLAFVYFTAASLGIYQLKSSFWSAHLAGLLLAICAFVFVLLPIVAFRPFFTVATVGLGWEAMLSAYSFVVERHNEPTPPSRADCVFFILVNPCVVYPNRGHRTEAANGTRIFVSRLGLGVFTWFAAAFVPAALTATRHHVQHEYALFWLDCGAAATALYFAHSGLASVQIAFAGLLGQELPERYVFPFLSKSPEEFWRRWNTYVTDWIRRYVFQPVALAIRRGWPRLPRSVAQSVAVVASFLSIGLLHDYALRAQGVASVGRFVATTTVTPVFLGCGVLLIVWHGATAWLRRIAASSAPFARVLARAWGVLSWVCFIHLAFGTVWLLQTGRLWP